MFWLKNKPSEQAKTWEELTDPTVDEVEEAPSLAGTPFVGDAVVFRDGFHYPALFDSEGEDLGPDLEHKLVWRDGGYHHAYPDDPSHFHRYGLNAVELEVDPN